MASPDEGASGSISASVSRQDHWSEGSPPRSRKRGNVSIACNPCRHKRSRCDGQKPCKLCVKSKTECTYASTDLRRKEFREEQVQALQSRLEDLESFLDVLKNGGANEAFEALQDFRSSGQLASRRNLTRTTSEGNPDDPSLSEDDIREILRDQKIRSSNVGLLEVDTAHESPVVFSSLHLPPEDTIREAVRDLLRMSAGFFHLITMEEFDELCGKVYHAEQEPHIIDLAELCGIAALGCQYSPSKLPGYLKDSLFRTTLLYLNDMIQVNITGAIRSAACLCGVGIMEQQKTTEILIRLGLQLSRRALDLRNDLDDVQDSWSRVYRTVVFFECWLSASLGYAPDLTDDEIQGIRSLNALGDGSSSEVTRTTISQVGVLKAQILRDTHGTSFLSARTIEEGMQRLDRWHQSLPETMTIETLMASGSNSIPDSQQEALLLAHAMYLGTVVHLHRRILVAVIESRLGNGWSGTDLSSAQAQQSHNVSIKAARTAADIFTLQGSVREKSGMPPHYWFYFFEILAACTMILYDVAVKFLLHNDGDLVTGEDINRAGSCLEMLKVSKRSNRATDKVYETLIPIHRSLSTLYRRERKLRPASIDERTVPGLINLVAECAADSGQVIHSDDAECSCVAVHQVIIDLAALLNDPFGHGEEGGSNLTARDQCYKAIDWWSLTPAGRD